MPGCKLNLFSIGCTAVLNTSICLITHVTYTENMKLEQNKMV